MALGIQSEIFSQATPGSPTRPDPLHIADALNACLILFNVWSTLSAHDLAVWTADSVPLPQDGPRPFSN